MTLLRTHGIVVVGIVGKGNIVKKTPKNSSSSSINLLL